MLSFLPSAKHGIFNDLKQIGILQEDVTFVKSGSLFKISGCVNLGPAYKNMTVLTTGNFQNKKLLLFSVYQ